MFNIRYTKKEDKEFWYNLDCHLPEKEFENKIDTHRAYIILEDEMLIGVMRYNMFWDNTPFLTLIYIDSDYHKQGYGRNAMEFWEQEMRMQGYKMIMTSTQVDEEAQGFYRRLGYKDCGCIVMDIPGFEQPMEMFMSKAL